MKKVLLFLADGFEEVEAVTPIDYLRRAEIEVMSAAVGNERMVSGSHKIPIQADVLLNDLYLGNRLNPEDWDAVLCPGGMHGAGNIVSSPVACDFLKRMCDEGKLLSAICASPAVVFAPLGILNGKRFTCFTGMETQVPHGFFQENRVVIDSNIITSRGAGTAIDWSYKMIEILAGKDKADALIKKIIGKI